MSALFFFLTEKEKYQTGWYEIIGFLTDIKNLLEIDAIYPKGNKLWIKSIWKD